jgi:hypothetical protein
LSPLKKLSILCNECSKENLNKIKKTEPKYNFQYFYFTYNRLQVADITSHNNFNITATTKLYGFEFRLAAFASTTFLTKIGCCVEFSRLWVTNQRKGDMLISKGSRIVVLQVRACSIPQP